MLGLMLMIACSAGPDLPDSWGDQGQAVLQVGQSECIGQPGNDLGVADMDVQEGLVLIDWNDAPFRCEQDVTGFWRTTDTELEVLIQPADMSGKQSTGCSCLYDINITVAHVPAGTWAARLLTRGDNANLPNDVAVVVTQEVTVP